MLEINLTRELHLIAYDLVSEYVGIATDEAFNRGFKYASELWKEIS